MSIILPSNDDYIREENNSPACVFKLQEPVERFIKQLQDEGKPLPKHLHDLYAGFTQHRTKKYISTQYCKESVSVSDINSIHLKLGSLAYKGFVLEQSVDLQDLCKAFASNDEDIGHKLLQRIKRRGYDFWGTVKSKEESVDYISFGLLAKSRNTGNYRFRNSEVGIYCLALWLSDRIEAYFQNRLMPGLKWNKLPTSAMNCLSKLPTTSDVCRVLCGMMTADEQVLDMILHELYIITQKHCTREIACLLEHCFYEGGRSSTNHTTASPRGSASLLLDFSNIYNQYPGKKYNLLCIRFLLDNSNHFSHYYRVNLSQNFMTPDDFAFLSVPREGGAINLLELSLKCNMVNSDGLRYLDGLFHRSKHLQSLDLDLCGIGIKGADLLADQVKEFPHLHTLKLKGNQITAPGLSNLGKSLRSCGELKHLDLSLNDLEFVGVKMFVKTFINRSKSHPLTHLALKRNKISDECALMFSKGFASLPYLTTLDLSCNRFTVDGALQIVGSIHNLPNLKSLDLNRNCIGPNRVSEVKELVERTRRPIDLRLDRQRAMPCRREQKIENRPTSDTHVVPKSRGHEKKDSHASHGKKETDDIFEPRTTLSKSPYIKKKPSLPVVNEIHHNYHYKISMLNESLDNEQWNHSGACGGTTEQSQCETVISDTDDIDEQVFILNCDIKSEFSGTWNKFDTIKSTPRTPANSRQSFCDNVSELSWTDEPKETEVNTPTTLTNQPGSENNPQTKQSAWDMSENSRQKIDDREPDIDNIETLFNKEFDLHNFGGHNKLLARGQMESKTRDCKTRASTTEVENLSKSPRKQTAISDKKKLEILLDDELDESSWSSWSDIDEYVSGGKRKISENSARQRTSNISPLKFPTEEEMTFKTEIDKIETSTGSPLNESSPFSEERPEARLGWTTDRTDTDSYHEFQLTDLDDDKKLSLVIDDILGV